MKMNNTLTILLLMFSMSLSAQQEGHIEYEEVTNLHKRMGDRAVEFKDMVPEKMTQHFELLFNTNSSLYRKDTSKVVDVPPPPPGGRRRGPRFGRRGMDRTIFIDLAENKRLEERNLFDKKVLIEDDPIQYNWKLTQETMQVGDYLAQKATFSDSTKSIVAWFTPQIPVPTGPSNYGGLPGMVLHIDIDEGTQVITATNIDLAPLDKKTFKAPSKGKRMTQEEFDQLRNERIKEMRAMRGGPMGRRRN